MYKGSRHLSIAPYPRASSQIPTIVSSTQLPIQLYKHNRSDRTSKHTITHTSHFYRFYHLVSDPERSIKSCIATKETPCSPCYVPQRLTRFRLIVIHVHPSPPWTHLRLCRRVVPGAGPQSSSLQRKMRLAQGAHGCERRAMRRRGTRALQVLLNSANRKMRRKGREAGRVLAMRGSVLEVSGALDPHPNNH
jgi:hypothetical protein